MNNKTKILIAEHDATDLELLERELKKGGVNFVSQNVNTETEFGNSLINFNPDIILSDYNFPSFSGTAAFKLREKLSPGTPFIYVTGSLGEEAAVEFIKDGVTDYVLKDRLFTLPSKVKRALNDASKKLQKVAIEQELRKSESQFRHTLNNMLEGMQIHDFKWRYIYVNDALVKYSSYKKEELLGFTMMEKYPGIENTDFFKVLQRSMNDRIPQQLEHEFIFPDGSKKYFELSIQPIKEGISIHSVDRTEQKRTHEKLLKSNRLYAFISQINQSIVHIKDEKELILSCCRIALKFGKFKMAWIGMFDYNNKNINLIAQSGIPEENLKLFAKAKYDKNGPQDLVINTGVYYACNDVQNNLELEGWKHYAAKQGIQSCMVLPIKKYNEIIGTFNLYSTELDFFDSEEIALLVEVTGDISFALENFEKERKHRDVEDLILRNENRFRALVENSTDAVAILSNNGNLKYISPSIKGILGYSEEEIMTLDFISLVHPDYALGISKVWELVIQNSGLSIPRTLTRMLHKDGTWRWLDNTVTNMLNDPSINGIVNNFRDITEKVNTEESLLQSEARLKEAQEIAHTSNWEIDLIKNIHTWSDELYNILGVDKNEVKPSTELFLTYVHPEDRELAQKDIQNSFNSLEPSRSSLRFIRKDGKMRYCYIERKFEFDKNDKPVRVFGILQDVTNRKVLEEEREKITSDLMQRNKDLEQFTYIVSHNLRAPVANIIGISSALRTIELNAEENEEMMYSLSASAMKLNGVIQDLNQILQIRTNISEKREEVSFSHLIKNIKISIDIQIKEEQAVINTDFSEIDKMPILKSYLYSIFYNLISNSIKYKQADLAPVIEIKSYKIGNKVELHYSDNGLGIDLKKKGDEVFGLYKRFHTHKEGKGMGMFMVKTQVETLGGKISIESELNVGTKFIIQLPL